jgi:hypothetical protein
MLAIVEFPQVVWEALEEFTVLLRAAAGAFCRVSDGLDGCAPQDGGGDQPGVRGHSGPLVSKPFSQPAGSRNAGVACIWPYGAAPK